MAVHECFPKYIFRWFVLDKLQDIILKEISNNTEAKSLNIFQVRNNKAESVVSIAFKKPFIRIFSLSVKIKVTS